MSGRSAGVIGTVWTVTGYLSVGRRRASDVVLRLLRIHIQFRIQSSKHLLSFLVLLQFLIILRLHELDVPGLFSSVAVFVVQFRRLSIGC